MDFGLIRALPSIVGIRALFLVYAVFMTAKHLDGTKFSIHLTSTGYVALESGQLSTDAELALFGPKGDVPPTSIPSLTIRLLKTINAAPDPTDAADLRLFARDLKASLAQVETILALLDKAND